MLRPAVFFFPASTPLCVAGRRWQRPEVGDAAEVLLERAACAVGISPSDKVKQPNVRRLSAVDYSLASPVTAHLTAKAHDQADHHMVRTSAIESSIKILTRLEEAFCRCFVIESGGQLFERGQAIGGHRGDCPANSVHFEDYASLI
jgi:hypothetical protein